MRSIIIEDPANRNKKIYKYVIKFKFTNTKKHSIIIKKVSVSRIIERHRDITLSYT